MLSFGQIDLAPKRECVAINTARDLVCIIVELAIRYAGCDIYGSIRHLAKLCTLIKKSMVLYRVMSTTCGRSRDPLCSSKCRGSASLEASACKQSRHQAFSIIHLRAYMRRSCRHSRSYACITRRSRGAIESLCERVLASQENSSYDDCPSISSSSSLK